MSAISPVRSARPPAGTIEAWCLELLEARELDAKLNPAPPPDACWEADAPARRLDAPGRPPELRPAERTKRSVGPRSLAHVDARARLVHTFLHHELQAAELFAWAVLAFPETPREFRAGLVRLCREELRHLHLYARHLEHLGHAVGAFAVRDWFWERVARCPDAASFCALQGIGLEGANLEHNQRFAERFRAAGDEAGARVLDVVERDEVAHVAFAVTWFERLTGRPLDYDTWAAALPAPLTPSVLQGRPLNRAARLAAGLDEPFLERLAAEPSTSLPRST